MSANTLYGKDNLTKSMKNVDASLSTENVDPSLLNITDRQGVENFANTYGGMSEAPVTVSGSHIKTDAVDAGRIGTRESLFKNYDATTQYYLNRLNEIRSALGRTDTRTATTNTLLTK